MTVRIDGLFFGQVARRYEYKQQKFDTSGVDSFGPFAVQGNNVSYQI